MGKGKVKSLPIDKQMYHLLHGFSSGLGWLTKISCKCLSLPRVIQDYPELTTIAMQMVISRDDEHISEWWQSPFVNRVSMWEDPQPSSAKVRDTVLQTVTAKPAGKDLGNYQAWASMTCKAPEKPRPSLLLETICRKIPTFPDNLIHIHLFITTKLR